MPPKKQKQTGNNGFYYFMLEFQAKHGRKFNSMKDVADAAGPHWSRMSKLERKPFDEKALLAKNNLKATKYTCDGFDVAEINRQEQQEQAQIAEMKEDIQDIIKMASRHGHIHKELFFIIEVNIFCKKDDDYFPAEIGIAGFSLENGILPENVYHSMIKCGPLPLGYAATAMLHSRETHKIRPPTDNTEEDNTEEVFRQVVAFLSNKMQGSKRMPFLYAEERHIKKIQQILNNWCDDYSENTHFKVYNLQYMFLTLRNAVAGDTVWPSDTFSYREIEKDVYVYETDITCSFHEATSVPRFCAKAIPIRYAYIICDNCCADANIDLIPGQHIPGATKFVPDRASSVSTTRSNRPRRHHRTHDDTDNDSVVSFSTSTEPWESESIASETASTVTSATFTESEDHFPILGVGRQSKNNSPAWGGFSSQKSYSGAMGTSGLSKRPAAKPSGLLSENGGGAASISSKSDIDSLSDFPQLGLGKGRAQPFYSSNFPGLPGRGRGLPAARGRGLTRPNDD